MPFYIAWDRGHKCRGNISENYSDLRVYLESIDFESYNFIDMITQETLRPYDILVFACPDFAKINTQEISEIEKWVKYDGGGLLLLSHAGGDRGRNSNLNELSELFGIAFENDQVLDERSNLGLENLPIIYSPVFNPPHPVTNNLDSICYRAGCSLTVVGGGAFAVATSNDTSDPFSSPIICVAESGNGRICCIGSYEMFRNKVGGGLQYDSHTYLAYNVFNWLLSDYRREFRASDTTTETPPAQGDDYQYQDVGQPDTAVSSTGRRKVDIDYAIRISSKSELLELLKIFSNQINTIKSSIDNLIERVFVSEDEIIELKQAQNSQTSTNSQNFEYSEQEYTELPPESSEAGEINVTDEPVLSALPEKPAELIKAQEELLKENEAVSDDDEYFVGLSKGEKEDKDKVKEKSKSKSKSKAKSKAKKGQEVSDTEKLKDEKESLESKVKSVRELITFTNKKLESGKIDQKAHQKQISKLEKDLKKTQDRIEKINELLK